MSNPFANPKMRAAIYALAAALLGALGIYGLVTQEQTTAFLNVIGAAVAVLALVNVPTGKGDE